MRLEIEVEEWKEKKILRLTAQENGETFYGGTIRVEASKNETEQEEKDCRQGLTDYMMRNRTP